MPCSMACRARPAPASRLRVASESLPQTEAPSFLAMKPADAFAVSIFPGRPASFASFGVSGLPAAGAPRRRLAALPRGLPAGQLQAAAHAGLPRPLVPLQGVGQLDLRVEPVLHEDRLRRLAQARQDLVLLRPLQLVPLVDGRGGD